MKKLLGVKPVYWIWSAVLAIIFGIMIPVGRSFKNNISLGEAFKNQTNITAGLIIAIILFIVLIFLFSIFNFLYERDLFRAKDQDRLRLFFENKWWIVWIILAAAGLVILYFIRPGIFMGDTCSQIAEAFNHEAYYFKDGIDFAYDDSTLTNMHPVLVTLAIKLCMLIGYNAFGSYIWGVTLMAALQIIILSFAVSISVNILSRINVRGWIILICPILLLINPLILNSTFVLAKDVIFCAALLVLAMETVIYLRNSGRLADKFLLAGAAFVASVFRTEGIYISVIVMLLLLFTFIKRKNITKKKVTYLLSIAGGLVILSILWTSIALPMLHVTPDLRSYKYTIPMQQVALYVIAHEDELTEEEKTSLNKVVDIDELKGNYNPTSADGVKSVFNNNATDEELDEFISTWESMVLKDPVLAFKAWLNNKYEYFYMENTILSTYKFKASSQHMRWLNELFKADDGTELGLGYLEKYADVRTTFESVVESIKTTPVLSILSLPAAYILLFIVFAVFVFTKKRAQGIIVIIIPLFMLVITNMFGSTNAHYGRYMLPLVLLFGFIIVSSLRAEDASD